jgi:5'-nucleotidase
LGISRASFCGGRNADRYFAAYNCKLFLSAEEDDVRKVIQNGGAAALVFPPSSGYTHDAGEVRIAFDADAVIFSDEAEKVFQEKGLPLFHASEVENARVPLQPGPFKPVLAGCRLYPSKVRSGTVADPHCCYA